MPKEAILAALLSLAICNQSCVTKAENELIKNIEPAAFELCEDENEFKYEDTKIGYDFENKVLNINHNIAIELPDSTMSWPVINCEKGRVFVIELDKNIIILNKGKYRPERLSINGKRIKINTFKNDKNTTRIKVLENGNFAIQGEFQVFNK